MTFMVHHLEIDDFDSWKQFFDEDPVGRKQAATGHVMLRGVDNPNSGLHSGGVRLGRGREIVPRQSPCFRCARQENYCVYAADGRGVRRVHHA